MAPRSLSDNIGPVQGEIIERATFETLTGDNVFIKRELTLLTNSGEKFPFANPEYIEYRNSTSGRKELIESKLDKKIIEAVILIWGDVPTVEEPEFSLPEPINPETPSE